MLNIMKYLVVVIFVVMSIYCNGQIKILKPYENLPKTPDAAIFTKVQTNTEIGGTGACSIEIPIGGIETNEIKIPISLQYSNTGIRVTDVETPAGLGWVLNTGGMVTRTVYGIPDETQLGWFNLKPVLNGCVIQDNLKQYYNKLRDTSPDIFTYHINGKSGSFYFDENDDIVTISSNDGFEIVRNFKSSGMLFFTIVDEKGIKYTFDVPENTHSIVEETSLNADLCNYDMNVIKTWKISEIDSPTRDTIKYNYVSYNLVTPRYIRCYKYITQVSNYDYKNSSISNPVACNDSYSLKQVKSIVSKYKRVDFEYESLSEGLIPTRLKSIKFYDLCTNTLINEAELVHNNSNSSNRLFLEKVNIYGKDRIRSPLCYTLNYDSRTFNFGVNQKDFFGYYSSKSSSTFSGMAYFDKSDGSVDVNSITASSLQKITYPTGGYVLYELEPNIDTISSVISTTGGLRVKSVKYYTESNMLVKAQEYTYSNLSGDVYTGTYWKYCSGTTFYGGTPTRACNSTIWSTEPLFSYQKYNGLYYKSIKVLDKNYYGDRTDEFYTVYNYNGYAGGYSYYPELASKALYKKDGTKVRNESYIYSSVVRSTRCWDLNDSYAVKKNDTFIGIETFKDCDGTIVAPHDGYFMPLNGAEIGGADKICKTNEQIIEYFTGENSVTTNNLFEYNNRSQLCKQTISLKNGESDFNKKTTNIKYASDYNDTIEWIRMLKSSNMISNPIDIRTYFDVASGKKLINGSQYEYNTKGQLVAEYKCNFDKYNASNDDWSSNKFNSSSFEKVAEYIYNNTSNNLTQQKNKSGIPTSYIWGYNNQYPVVKATNVTEESLKKVVANLITKTINSEVLKDTINKIRAQIQATGTPTSVNGYVFNPSIGISSLIDQNGKVKSYGYDVFGRLESVKDFDNTYQNHYAYKYYDEKYYLNIENPILNYTYNGPKQTVRVSSNTACAVKSNDSWITVSQASLNGSASFDITCSSNSGQSRAGTVTVQSTGISGVITNIINITQAGSIVVSTSELNFGCNLEIQNVAVNSSASWIISSKVGSFITATKVDESTLRIRCSSNSSISPRSGSVTISNGITTSVISVEQAAYESTIE